MKIGFVGLGKMGSQIVAKLLAAQHQVVVLDINEQAVQGAVSQGAVAAQDRQDMVTQLGEQPVVWLMIPADYVQAEVEEFNQLLPAGSVLIDGGNSFYERTLEHARACSQQQVNFVDVGTSGGIMGLEQGFSMMVGGSAEAVTLINPLLDVLAAPHGGYVHVGATGAGHYVKMIHNGIEYGMMQAYAEGYNLLHSGPLHGIDLAAVAKVWQQGSIINSTLNGLIQDILVNNPQLEGVDGYVAATGEGQWTYDTASKANAPMPALKAALDVRQASQIGDVYYGTKLLAAMRGAFGGHAINKDQNHGA